MNKQLKMLMVITFGLMISLGGFAQDRTPRTNGRQVAQRARIHEGRVDGEVTKRGCGFECRTATYSQG